MNKAIFFWNSEENSESEHNQSNCNYNLNANILLFIHGTNFHFVFSEMCSCFYFRATRRNERLTSFLIEIRCWLGYCVRILVDIVVVMLLMSLSSNSYMYLFVGICSVRTSWRHCRRHCHQWSSLMCVKLNQYQL